MYLVSPELYREASDRLLDAVGSKTYFSGSVAFPFVGTECRLTVSVIVYRERIVLPEGVAEAITDLVPVWWEFHTWAESDEMVNDFSFSDLRCFVR